MNKKGVMGWIIAIVIIALAVASYFILFFNNGGISCPITPEGEAVIRMPLSGIIAVGKQTGAENHELITVGKISLCCAEVESSEGRGFKDCIRTEDEEFYGITWEIKNRNLVKVREVVPWQGLTCYYDFDSKGDWVRSCQDEEEEINIEKPEYNSIEECENLQDTSRSICYYEVACKTGDVSICEMFEEEKGYSHASTTTCYSCVAVTNEDGALCNKVFDNYLRSKCYENFEEESFDPNTAFTVTDLNCGATQAIFSVVLNQELVLLDFGISFRVPTQGFSTSGSRTWTEEHKTFIEGQTKEYLITYTDYMGNFVGPPETMSLYFTTDTGQYNTDSLNC